MLLCFGRLNNKLVRRCLAFSVAMPALVIWRPLAYIGGKIVIFDGGSYDPEQVSAIGIEMVVEAQASVLDMLYSRSDPEESSS